MSYRIYTIVPPLTIFVAGAIIDLIRGKPPITFTLWTITGALHREPLAVCVLGALIMGGIGLALVVESSVPRR